LADLVRVEQQLAGAGGRRIVVAAWKVRGDGQALEPHLTVAHMRVRFAETRLAAPQRLDLRARTYEPGLPSFQEMVVVTHPRVARDCDFVHRARPRSQPRWGRPRQESPGG